MNLLFVGGSNSVMNPGYVGYTVEHLRAAGHEISSVQNISVGANNCLIGLEQVKLFRDLAKIDKIVIEFAVNDYKMITPGSLPLWERGYEGLVRYILSKNPNVQIYNLMLAPREALPHRIRRLREGMLAITRHYARRSSVFFVDFDSYLWRRVANDPAKFKSFYIDAAHYSRPRGAAVVARYLAQALGRKVEPVSALLPPPLYSNSFDAAGIYDLSAVDDATVREFRNSRFQRRSHPLAPGQKLVVDLPGSLISLSFLATSNSLPLLIEEEDEPPILIYTTHAGLLKTPQKFLIKNFVVGGKKWSDADAKRSRRLALTAIGHDDLSEELSGLLADRNNMIPPQDGGGGAYLSNLLYFRSSRPGPILSGDASRFGRPSPDLGMPEVHDGGSGISRPPCPSDTPPSDHSWRGRPIWAAFFKLKDAFSSGRHR